MNEVESRIIDDQPMVVLHARLSVIVFKPVVGAVLCGEVNKIGMAHIGCIVHDCFNARVYFQMTSNMHVPLTDEQAAFINELKVGSNLLFRVSKLSVQQDLLQITGSIEHRLFCEDADQMDSYSLKPVPDAECTRNFYSSMPTIPKSASKQTVVEDLSKKAKKRKHKDISSNHLECNGQEENLSVEQATPEISSVVSVESSDKFNKKHKKKKKHKDKVQCENLVKLSRGTLQEIADSDMNQNVLLEHTVPSEKSNSKTATIIKHEPSTEDESSFTRLKNKQSDDMPARKKKKKTQKLEML